MVRRYVILISLSICVFLQILEAIAQIYKHEKREGAKSVPLLGTTDPPKKTVPNG